MRAWWLCSFDVRIEVQMIVTSVNCAWNSFTDLELHQSLKPVQETRLEEQSYASLITSKSSNNSL